MDKLFHQGKIDVFNAVNKVLINMGCVINHKILKPNSSYRANNIFYRLKKSENITLEIIL